MGNLRRCRRLPVVVRLGCADLAAKTGDELVDEIKVAARRAADLAAAAGRPTFPLKFSECKIAGAGRDRIAGAASAVKMGRYDVVVQDALVDIGDIVLGMAGQTVSVQRDRVIDPSDCAPLATPSLWVS